MAASLGALTFDADVAVVVRQAWTIAVSIEGTAEEAVATLQQARGPRSPARSRDPNPNPKPDPSPSPNTV